MIERASSHESDRPDRKAEHAINALDQQIKIHNKHDQRESLLVQAMGLLGFQNCSTNRSLKELEDLKDRAGAVLASGDKQQITNTAAEIAQKVNDDKRLLERKDTVTYCATNILKTGSLFLRGPIGYGLAGVTHALDQAKWDSLGRSSIDGSLGFVKGLGMKYVLDKTGNWQVGAVTKGAGLGLLNTGTELLLNRQTWQDKDTGLFSAGKGFSTILNHTFDLKARAVDGAVFAGAHGMFGAANAITRDALNQSPFMRTVLTGTTFGLSSGAAGEYMRQLENGENLNIWSIARQSLVRGALDTVSSGLAHGINLAAYPGHGLAVKRMDRSERESKSLELVEFEQEAQRLKLQFERAQKSQQGENVDLYKSEVEARNEIPLQNLRFKLLHKDLRQFIDADRSRTELILDAHEIKALTNFVVGPNFKGTPSDFKQAAEMMLKWHPSSTAMPFYINMATELLTAARQLVPGMVEPGAMAHEILDNNGRLSNYNEVLRAPIGREVPAWIAPAFEAAAYKSARRALKVAMEKSGLNPEQKTSNEATEPIFPLRGNSKPNEIVRSQTAELLLKEIEVNPLDNSRILILADCLEEQGQHHRAEIMRGRVKLLDLRPYSDEYDKLELELRKKSLDLLLNSKDLDLSFLHLTKLILDGFDFSGADLRGTNFRGSSLYRAKFSGADTRGCDFRNANDYSPPAPEADGSTKPAWIGRQ